MLRHRENERTNNTVTPLRQIVLYLCSMYVISVAKTRTGVRTTEGYGLTAATGSRSFEDGTSIKYDVCTYWIDNTSHQYSVPRNVPRRKFYASQLYVLKQIIIVFLCGVLELKVMAALQSKHLHMNLN